ncbi:hypothetical protein Pcinc_036615 [Petrolisthes cinctipes]|uniref:15-hydroxyprostaglandin dehydrogenase [NAD(+)] n=1 Tax=Petrolisthes cinctipes TaxID=88211 RepID=A0AAE1EM70_PETCI|nr:hypothetical protein Pcinc_036615 [Petrolisthes cinctipes]
MFAKCDVTQDEDFKGAWDAAEENLGPVNVLINNAGIGNEKKWELTLNINVGGYIRGTMLALERLGRNQNGSGGTVINISSVAGVKPVPFGPVYCATKYAIVGFTRAMGHDLHLARTGVKIQALCPSLVKTDLLTDSVKNAISPEVGAAMAKYAEGLKEMTVETVAGALVKLLTEGKSGACMVVEAEKEPYYVNDSV